jgi:TonB family protein
MKSVILILAVALLVTVTVVIRRQKHETAEKLPHSVASLSTPLSSPTTKPRHSPKVIPPPGRMSKGVKISGPLERRTLISIVLPEYPEWAEFEGVTGEVSAKIWVLPEGRVSSLIQVTRVSTEQRFDDLALDAVRQWRFAKVPKAQGKQWGIVTFQFKLHYPKPTGNPWTQTAQAVPERPILVVAMK